MKFEILCLDDKEAVKSRTVKTFLYMLMANDILFENPSMNDGKGELIDSSKRIRLHITQFSTDRMLTGARYSVAYIVSTECEDLSTLDTFRIQLIDYIKSIGFSNVRILVDEVSKELAISLYPELYNLENKVRAFIINFFLKNLGTNWAKFAMPVDTLKKIKSRKNNDKIFIVSERIDSDVSLIDFDDLGKILFNENSIFSIQKADNVAILIEKISKAEDLEKLKSEVLEGNFYKYFKDCFTQKDFQNKWNELYYYRNKLAHTGAFSEQEQELCKQLCEEVAKMIDSAYEKGDTFKLSTSDREALMVAVNEFANASPEECIQNASQFASVSEQTLLEELSIAQRKLPYVGLRYFVREWLGEKGYDYDSSFTLINYLVDQEVIRLYKVEEPNSEYPVTALAHAN